MKWLSICLLFWALICQPLSAQEPVADEDFSDVEELAATLKGMVPYYDEESHLSLTGVILNLDGRFLRVEFALPKGQLVNEADWYLNYMVRKWDLQPLLEHAFDLRLLLKHPREPKNPNLGSSAFNFHPEDIQAAIDPPIEDEARTFIASLARRIDSRLPHATGVGETMVECRYDEAGKVMTTVYEYDTQRWPEVRKYVVENMEWVRKDRAADLVMDTANHLAFVAYKGDVVLRHVYRDAGHTDSVEMLIVPWMWKSVFERGSGSYGSAMGQVQSIADELDMRCPMKVDEHTSLERCKLDTAARRLTYEYRLSDTAMMELLRSARQQEALTAAVYNSYATDEGRRLASHLVSAGVEVDYHYSSSLGEKPFDITITADELKKIVSTQQ